MPAVKRRSVDGVAPLDVAGAPRSARVSGSRRCRSHATTNQISGQQVDQPPAVCCRESARRRASDGDAGAEPAGHRQHAERVGAAAARHLLGGDDADEQRQREAERAADRLGGDEHPEVRRQPRRAGRHSGASQAVTTIIRRRPQRSARIANGMAITTPSRTITPPTPWPLLSMPKLVGREVGGLGEQRVGERGRQSRPRRAGRAARTWRASAGRAAPTTASTSRRGARWRNVARTGRRTATRTRGCRGGSGRSCAAVVHRALVRGERPVRAARTGRARPPPRRRSRRRGVAASRASAEPASSTRVSTRMRGIARRRYRGCWRGESG